MVMNYSNTLFNQVFGDYNKLVEDLLKHLQETEDYPPSYIHIDATFCRVIVPGQFADSVSRFLERQGF